MTWFRSGGQWCGRLLVVLSATILLVSPCSVWTNQALAETDSDCPKLTKDEFDKIFSALTRAWMACNNPESDDSGLEGVIDFGLDVASKVPGIGSVADALSGFKKIFQNAGKDGYPTREEINHADECKAIESQLQAFNNKVASCPNPPVRPLDYGHAAAQHLKDTKIEYATGGS